MEEMAVEPATVTDAETVLEPRVAEIVVDPKDAGRIRLESPPFAFAAKLATAGVEDTSVAAEVTSTYVPAQKSQTTFRKLRMMSVTPRYEAVRIPFKKQS